MNILEKRVFGSTLNITEINFVKVTKGTLGNVEMITSQGPQAHKHLS